MECLPASRAIRLALLAAGLLSACGPTLGASAESLTIGGDPRIDPARFRVTTFASGLQFPTSLQQLDDGSLLVAVAQSTSPNFFAAPGDLLRLVDADHDGVADDAGQVLYSGLPGVTTSLRRAGSLLVAATARGGQERINILRPGATPDAPLSLLGAVQFAFPSGWEHKSYALAVRPAPGAGQYEVFFNVGSRLNFGNDATAVAVSGMLSGSVLGESIYRMVLNASGPTVTVDGLERVASGLRNAAGLAFDPATGDLLFEDNGIDTPGNATEAFSADELNRLPAEQIGGAVEDFGFAGSYVAYRTGVVIGGQGLAPLVAFQPLGDPQTGSESEGAVEISFLPPAFPEGLAGLVAVGFHGQGQLAGVANEENPLVLADPSRGQYFHLVNNDQPGVGHLDGLLATDDSLFVADLSGTGALSALGTGAIYQIRYLGPPLVGDANGDCSVGAADYALWGAQFGQTGPGLSADFDGNQAVGAGDYALWAANFGHACDPPAASARGGPVVPEPATAPGLLVGLAALIGSRRSGRGSRRRRRVTR